MARREYNNPEVIRRRQNPYQGQQARYGDVVGSDEESREEETDQPFVRGEVNPRGQNPSGHR